MTSNFRPFTSNFRPFTSNLQPTTYNFQRPTSNVHAKRPISIVLVNWNGVAHLPVCLNALRAQTFRHFEIILVDNASRDDSLALLARAYPEVTVIPLPDNRGFAGGSNVGLRAAHGDILILLNTDTEVDAHWLAEVAAAFERHPEAGSVASKMKLFEHRDTFHTTGDFYRVDGLPGNRGVWEIDRGQYDREEYVFSACGGSAAYRRALLEQIGLLDEDFFFSCEDVDLGWRAQLAGWPCIYAPNAIVYHKLKATGGGATASYYDGRNFLWLIAKNYPAPLWKRYRGAIIRTQGTLFIEAVRAWRGEAARARIRGLLAGLIGLPPMLHKRRAVQALRRVDDDYVLSILQPQPQMP
jgi:GT2 family glycosyltransferase